MANRHFAEHGDVVVHRKCKQCGAAWAILHCDTALKEEASHRMLETLIASRQALDGPWSRLHAGVVGFADAKRNRKHKTIDGDSPKSPLPPNLSKEDFTVLPKEIRRVLFHFIKLKLSMEAAESDLCIRCTEQCLPRSVLMVHLPWRDEGRITAAASAVPAPA